MSNPRRKELAPRSGKASVEFVATKAVSFVGVVLAVWSAFGFVLYQALAMRRVRPRNHRR